MLNAFSKQRFGAASSSMSTCNCIELRYHQDESIAHEQEESRSTWSGRMPSARAPRRIAVGYIPVSRSHSSRRHAPHAVSSRHNSDSAMPKFIPTLVLDSSRQTSCSDVGASRMSVKFSKIPTIPAEIRTSPFPICSLLTVVSRAAAFTNHKTGQVLIVCGRN